MSAYPGDVVQLFLVAVGPSNGGNSQKWRVQEVTVCTYVEGAADVVFVSGGVNVGESVFSCGQNQWVS